MEVVNADIGVGVSSPVAARSFPPLRYSCQLYDKGTGTLPLLIPGDARREYLGFFLRVGSGDIAARPALSIDDGWIALDNNERIFEMRYSSHGPLMRDEWMIDSPGGGGQVTVIILTSEG